MCPIVREFGMDMVWFGIVAIIAIETGLITPPFGMCVYTVRTSLEGLEGVENVTIEEIFSGSMPFLLGMIAVLILLIFVPNIVTYLPNLMTKTAN
jgi:TRAP-type C4-dicarboxylate transport system permease large subunit